MKGCGNSIIGPNELWSKKKNIKLSLKALEAIMQKFGHHSRFWGIEVKASLWMALLTNS
jgi:hypothetical protein